jgi:hypothetical protein
VPVGVRLALAVGVPVGAPLADPLTVALPVTVPDTLAEPLAVSELLGESEPLAVGDPLLLGVDDAVPDGVLGGVPGGVTVAGGVTEAEMPGLTGAVNDAVTLGVPGGVRDSETVGVAVPVGDRVNELVAVAGGERVNEPVGVAGGDRVGVLVAVAGGERVSDTDDDAVDVLDGVPGGVAAGVPDTVLAGVPAGVPAGVGDALGHTSVGTATTLRHAVLGGRVATVVNTSPAGSNPHSTPVEDSTYTADTLPPAPPHTSATERSGPAPVYVAVSVQLATGTAAAGRSKRCSPPPLAVARSSATHSRVPLSNTKPYGDAADEALALVSVPPSTPPPAAPAAPTPRKLALDAVTNTCAPVDAVTPAGAPTTPVARPTTRPRAGSADTCVLVLPPAVSRRTPADVADDA